MWHTLKIYLINPFEHPISGFIGAALATSFTTLYGAGEIAIYGMSLYVMIIALDWLSGYSASKKDGSYSSEYGIQGAYRTTFMLLFPALGNLADQLLSTPNIAFGFIVLSFTHHVWKSMTANVYRAGWGVWIPVWVLERVSDEIEHKKARAQKRIEERQKYLKRDDVL